MLIVIEFFVKGQSELDSPELDSPLSSSSELEEELEESEFRKVWNMLSVQHCMPFAFSCHSIYLAGKKIEDRGDKVVTFTGGGDRGVKERTYGTLRHDICNTGKKRYEWNDQRTLL